MLLNKSILTMVWPIFVIRLLYFSNNWFPADSGFSIINLKAIEYLYQIDFDCLKVLPEENHCNITLIQGPTLRNNYKRCKFKF